MACNIVREDWAGGYRNMQRHFERWRGGHDLSFPFLFFFEREKKLCCIYANKWFVHIYWKLFSKFRTSVEYPFYILQHVFRFREFRARKNGITVIIGIYDRDISYAVSSFFVGKSFPCKITFYGFSFFVFLYVHICTYMLYVHNVLVFRKLPWIFLKKKKKKNERMMLLQ